MTTARSEALTEALKVEDPSVLEIVKVVSDVWEPLLRECQAHIEAIDPATPPGRAVTYLVVRLREALG